VVLPLRPLRLLQQQFLTLWIARPRVAVAVSVEPMLERRLDQQQKLEQEREQVQRVLHRARPMQQLSEMPWWRGGTNYLPTSSLKVLAASMCRYCGSANLLSWR